MKKTQLLTCALAYFVHCPRHCSPTPHLSTPHTHHQVHRVRLHDGREAAMKVQYPGVARSIESDVDNLMRLITVANILPKGLYVQNAVKVSGRREWVGEKARGRGGKGGGRGEV